jgi:hypothetical protein
MEYPANVRQLGCEGVNSISPIQYSENQRALVNTVTNPQVPHSFGIHSTSSATASNSRKILVRGENYKILFF